MKKFNQARVNGGSNYDSTLLGSQKRRESAMLVCINVGDTVKLRGSPKAFATAAMLKSVVCTRVMTSGMVITQRMLTMGNPQPSPNGSN